LIAIIDYGAGNIRSVEKAFAHIGCEAVITASPEVIAAADAAVLPGVGSFGSAVDNLSETKMGEAAKNFIASGKPFLGICLGLQALFDSSEESPGYKGLGVFSGEVLRLPDDCGLKIPHIGWNSLELNRDCPLFANLPDDPYVYFVHSYYLRAKDESIVAATTEYGAHIHAAVWKDNCFAMQFHPEKSGKTGLAILRNFADLIGRDK